MPTILIVNGPNLNSLGKRSTNLYGSKTLVDIESAIQQRANELNISIKSLQSNHEGAIVDFVQEFGSKAHGVIINPGAFTSVGYSILDALIDTNLPVIEVHLSNIHAREKFRSHSVIAPMARGQICGMGWRGYLYALDYLYHLISDSGH